MSHLSGCMICGKDLVYLNTREDAHCHFCHEPQQTDVRCTAGHFICDKCHSCGAIDLIERYCMRTRHTDPLQMSFELMKSPTVKMHGPEHHFLVPAVMLTAYYNTLEKNGEKGEPGEKREKNRGKRIRSVGFYGACGAAIGTGIFISLVTGATPLAKQEWMLSNRMTAQSLSCIAACGGPRCCKRDSFIAITEAIAFVKENFRVNIDFNPDIKCEFHHINRECLHHGCQFYEN